MAGVTINSGPVDPEMYLKQVPPTKWAELVYLRRDFMDRRLSYDCRCLSRFIKEARQMWQPLGYRSLDDMIAKGYDLEPEEVNLAARWLDLNDPPEAISLREVISRVQQVAADNPNPIASHGGSRGGAGRPKAKDGDDSVSLTEVVEAIRDNQPAKEKKQQVDFLVYGSTHAPYLVRRLRRDHPDVAKRLEAGEFKSVSAAWRAAKGEEPHPPRRKATVMEKFRNLLARASETDKQEMLRLLGGKG